MRVRVLQGLAVQATARIVQVLTFCEKCKNPHFYLGGYSMRVPVRVCVAYKKNCFYIFKMLL